MTRLWGFGRNYWRLETDPGGLALDQKIGVVIERITMFTKWLSHFLFMLYYSLFTPSCFSFLYPHFSQFIGLFHIFFHSSFQHIRTLKHKPQILTWIVSRPPLIVIRSFFPFRLFSFLCFPFYSFLKESGRVWKNLKKFERIWKNRK